MISDLHCPANLSSIAGESNSGLRDGRKSFISESLITLYLRQPHSFSSVIAVMHQSASLTFLDWCQERKMTLFSLKQMSLKTKTTLFPSPESIPSLAHFLQLQLLAGVPDGAARQKTRSTGWN